MSYPFHQTHQTTSGKRSLVFIDDVGISQDQDGRFSLNDLHKASGGAKRHSPSYWLENQQTQELIEEIRKSLNPLTTGIPVVKEIQPVKSVPGAPSTGGGTFVIRELVYAYAMWVSPAFHLKVIRTFDAMVTGAARPNPYQTEMFGAVPDPIKMSRLFGSCVRMSKLAGLKGDDAVLAADDLTVRSCGVSPLEMLKHPLAGGAVKRPAPTPEPTEEHVAVVGKPRSFALAGDRARLPPVDFWRRI